MGRYFYILRSKTIVLGITYEPTKTLINSWKDLETSSYYKLIKYDSINIEKFENMLFDCVIAISSSKNISIGDIWDICLEIIDPNYKIIDVDIYNLAFRLDHYEKKINTLKEYVECKGTLPNEDSCDYDLVLWYEKSYKYLCTFNELSHINYEFATAYERIIKFKDYTWLQQLNIVHEFIVKNDRLPNKNKKNEWPLWHFMVLQTRHKKVDNRWFEFLNYFSQIIAVFKHNIIDIREWDKNFQLLKDFVHKTKQIPNVDNCYDHKLLQWLRMQYRSSKIREIIGRETMWNDYLRGELQDIMFSSHV